VRFSQAAPENLQQADILIIDSIGMLSSLYRYGQLAYIGGGFGKGIHNILEAAAYGIPVIFGPNYSKFREAVELLHAGGAFTCSNHVGLSDIIYKLRNDKTMYDMVSLKADAYVKHNTGATRMILDHLLNASVLQKVPPVNE
jgi:3-deoxy-D-manno-octulosonic-acid transferase